MASLQLTRAAPAKTEDDFVLLDEIMYLVQQLGNLLDFVNEDEFPFVLANALPEPLWFSLVKGEFFRLPKLNQWGFWIQEFE